MSSLSDKYKVIVALILFIMILCLQFYFRDSQQQQYRIINYVSSLMNSNDNNNIMSKGIIDNRSIIDSNIDYYEYNKNGEKYFINSSNEILLSSTNLSIKLNSTVITSLLFSKYDINTTITISKPSDKYRNWLNNTATFKVPMIIYINPKPISFVNYIIQIRNDLLIKYNIPTLIITIEFENLEFWNYKDMMINSIKTHETRHDINVCLAWSSKVNLVKRASLKNPFHSKYFIWIDAGMFRDFREYKWLQEYNENYPNIIWPNNDRIQLLNDNRLHLMQLIDNARHLRCEQYLNTYNGHINAKYGLIVTAAGFAGTRDAILKFSAAVSMTFHDAWFYDYYFSQPCYEQGIWWYISCKYPDLVTFVSQYHAENQSIQEINFRGIIYYFDNDTTKYTFVLN